MRHSAHFLNRYIHLILLSLLFSSADLSQHLAICSKRMSLHLVSKIVLFPHAGRASCDRVRKAARRIQSRNLDPYRAIVRRSAPISANDPRRGPATAVDSGLLRRSCDDHVVSHARSRAVCSDRLQFLRSADAAALHRRRAHKREKKLRRVCARLHRERIRLSRLSREGDGARRVRIERRARSLALPAARRTVPPRR